MYLYLGFNYSSRVSYYKVSQKKIRSHICLSVISGLPTHRTFIYLPPGGIHGYCIKEHAIQQYWFAYRTSTFYLTIKSKGFTFNSPGL